MFMLDITICIKNIGVQHSLEKNETTTMFFLQKPFLVFIQWIPLKIISCDTICCNHTICHDTGVRDVLN